MGCEICGKEASLSKTIIEGVMMQTCSKCSSLGKVVGGSSQSFQSRTSMSNREPSLTVTANYSSKIRQAREKSGLDQKTFAAKIKESESTLRHLEAGTLHPSIEQAQRFEKILGMKLTLLESSGEIEQTEKKSEGMTLGDVIKIKNKL